MQDDKSRAEQKAELAQANFQRGCNCAQSVLLAFAQETGLDEDTLMRLGAPFGGGMGRMREVCGAVSGMLMVLGLKKGYTLQSGDKAAHYRTVRELAERFKEKNGSIVCRELLAGAIVKPGGDPETRTPEYYTKRPCAQYCADAARLVQEELERV